MKRGHKYQMRAAMRDGHPPHHAVKIAEEMRRQATNSTYADSAPGEATPDYMGGPPDIGENDQMRHGGMKRKRHMFDGGTTHHGQMPSGMENEHGDWMAGGGVQQNRQPGQIDPEMRRRAMDEYTSLKPSSSSPTQDPEFSQMDPDKQPRTKMRHGGMRHMDGGGTEQPVQMPPQTIRANQPAPQLSANQAQAKQIAQQVIPQGKMARGGMKGGHGAGCMCKMCSGGYMAKGGMKNGHLTAKSRNAMKSSTFAVPSERAYPINDASHARNALARASGKSVEGQVRAAVHRKFPSIGSK